MYFSTERCQEGVKNSVLYCTLYFMLYYLSIVLFKAIPVIGWPDNIHLDGDMMPTLPRSCFYHFSLTEFSLSVKINSSCDYFPFMYHNICNQAHRRMSEYVLDIYSYFFLASRIVYNWISANWNCLLCMYELRCQLKLPFFFRLRITQNC